MQTNPKKPQLDIVELTGYDLNGEFSRVLLTIFSVVQKNYEDQLSYADWNDSPDYHSVPQSLLGTTW